MPDGAAAGALPEFTRALRGFAAVHALGQPTHDAIFVPFIEARRAAHRARFLSEQLQALDATTLKLALEAALAALAEARWPASAPDRRALEAYLADAARLVFEALARADRAARWLSAAGEADRAGCWNGWVESLATVFRELDTFWRTIQPTLAPLPDRLRLPVNPRAPQVVTE